MTTTNHLSPDDNRVLREARGEMATLLLQLPDVANEYRAGMNREGDLREILNTVIGDADLIARQFGIEL